MPAVRVGTTGGATAAVTVTVTALEVLAAKAAPEAGANRAVKVWAPTVLCFTVVFALPEESATGVPMAFPPV